ncbi:MAG: hypothetical protein PHE43_01910 [Candidatus Nanoarchaeia archaeon]|nr:hypothetical protein [Candidatus Nanoarchaeia archaeon]
MKKEIFIIFILMMSVVIAQDEYDFDESTIVDESYVPADEEYVPDENTDETTDEAANEPLEGPSYGETDVLTSEETEYGSGCETGCSYNDKCVNEGKQFLTQENGKEVYCSTSGKIEDAKAVGSVCESDYECLSYYCSDGKCSETSIKTVRKIGIVNILMFILAIILIIIIIFAAKNLRLKIKKTPEAPVKKETKKFSFKPIFRRETKTQVDEELEKIK